MFVCSHKVDTGSLTEPEAHGYAYVSWPVSPVDPPVSPSPATLDFSGCAGNRTQILSLSQQTLLPTEPTP